VNALSKTDVAICGDTILGTYGDYRGRREIGGGGRIVPEEEQHEPTDDFPGLVRAADLIGQLAAHNRSAPT
jgi:hypothetical protein